MDKSKLKLAMMESLKPLIAWKTWVAAGLLAGINGLIALGTVGYLVIAGGYSLSSEILLASWVSALFSSILWIVLVSRSKEEKE